MKRRFYLISSLCLILLSAGGCSTYIIKAAYEQSKILINRERISTVLENKHISDEIKSKLKLISDVREFSKELALNPKKSFTYYTKLDRDVASWLVIACKKDSFTLKTWWFPIVGTVPYKGFFKKEDALVLAKQLDQEGYETSVRGAIAYSTLGWFNDPVLTPLLKREELSIINTVLHEIFHSTIWYENNVEKNESSANFFAGYATLEYAKKRRPDLIESAQKALETELLAARVVTALYEALESNYNDMNLSFEEKIQRKEELFANAANDLRIKIPDIKILKNPNNAELMQLKLYLSGFEEMIEQNFYDEIVQSNAKNELQK